MKAVNHIFLFRFISDSRNEKINEEKASRNEALYEISFVKAPFCAYLV